jgi:hypothetical protein
MKKVFLFLIILAGLAMLEPRSRAVILRRLGPGPEHRVEQTLAQIADRIRANATETGIYPFPDAFAQWLADRSLQVQDAWGSPYYLELLADSFVVGSPGPDARRWTGDDLRLSTRRPERAPTARQGNDPAGTPPPITPPAPPASGVKETAIERARRARG